MQCLHFQSGRNVDVNDFPFNTTSNIENNSDILSKSDKIIGVDWLDYWNAYIAANI